MKNLTYILIFIFLFAACVKEEIDFNKISTEIDLNASVIVPLAYGGISINEILPTTSENDSFYIFIDQANDNLLHVRYNSALDSFNMAELLKPVPDQTNEVVFTAGFDFITNEFNEGTHVFIEQNTVYDFDPGDANRMLLDSFVIETGTLWINVAADFIADGSYTIVMPTLKDADGNTVNETFRASTLNSPAHEINLAGYSVGLLSGGNRNSFDITYIVNIWHKAGNDINNGSKITCSVEAVDLEIASFYGYLGQYVTAFDPFTLDLDFSDQIDGDIFIADPRISLIIENSFGFPVRTTLTDMKAIINGGTDIDFIVNPPNNPKDIAHPSFTDANNNEIGVVKHDTIFINNITSNIAEIISALPNQITLGGKFEINADNNQTELNFITKDSYLKASFALDLPIDFGLTNFAFSDTSDMDLNDMITNLENVTELVLDISFDNGLPIGFEAEVFFYEQKSETNPSMALVPIDVSIFENDKITIGSAQTSSGKVTSNNNTVLSISVTDVQLEKLKNTKFMILKLYINTDNPNNLADYSVKIHSTDKISFKIGAKTTASAQLD